MPFPLVPLIGAGASLLGGIFGNAAQSRQNRLDREFQREMYARQRQDALADWNMQNEYNSPQQQMARLKAGGLNPNLVYGNGAVANSSSMPRQSSPSGSSYKAPTALAESIPSAFNTFVNLQRNQVEVDNLKKQGELLQKQKDFYDVKAIDMLTGIDWKKVKIKDTQFNLGMKESLATNTMEFAEEKLRNLRWNMQKGQVELGLKADKVESEIARNSQSMAESMQRIISMRIGRAKTQEEIENLKAMRDNLNQNLKNKSVQYDLLRWEKQLSESGLQKGDYWWLRANDQLLKKYGRKLPDSKFEAGESDVIPQFFIPH